MTNEFSALYDLLPTNKKAAQEQYPKTRQIRNLTKFRFNTVVSAELERAHSQGIQGYFTAHPQHPDRAVYTITYIEPDGPKRVAKADELWHGLFKDNEPAKNRHYVSITRTTMDHPHNDYMAAYKEPVIDRAPHYLRILILEEKP